MPYLNLCVFTKYLSIVHRILSDLIVQDVETRTFTITEDTRTTRGSYLIRVPLPP